HPRIILLGEDGMYLVDGLGPIGHRAHRYAPTDGFDDLAGEDRSETAAQLDQLNSLFDQRARHRDALLGPLDADGNAAASPRSDHGAGGFGMKPQKVSAMTPLLRGREDCQAAHDLSLLRAATGSGAAWR